MNIVGSLIKVLEHGLSIIDTRQSRQYLREVINLKQEFYDEMAKPEDKRNNAVIDNVFLRLDILSSSFATLGAPKSGDS